MSGIADNETQFWNMLAKDVPAAVLMSGIADNEEQPWNMLVKSEIPDVHDVPTMVAN